METQNTLKDEVDNYEPPELKTVAELDIIDLTMEIKEDIEAKFPYKYIEANGEKFKIPQSVIGAIQDIIELTPGVNTFKVKKSGTGLKTKYTTVPCTPEK